MDDEPQYLKSKYELDQFNMIKRIIINFAFRNRGKLILSPDIVNDIMDEMRCERKILMVLENRNVNKYIDAEMTELNLNDQNVL